jgi:nucleotide-binding universal stress UspA family protein
MSTMTPMTDHDAPVLVGVDGSAAAHDAARWAGALAERFDAPLQLVHGRPKLCPNLTEASTVYRVALLQYHADNAEHFLKDAADAVRSERPILTVTTGFEIAERLGVALHAVHSWSSWRPAGDVTIPWLIDWEAIEALQFSALIELVDEYHRDHSGVEVQCFLEAAGPGRALLEHVTFGQLVIVGNRGRPALAAAAMGSTSLNLLHHSPIPVMVCHPAPGET